MNSDRITAHCNAALNVVLRAVRIVHQVRLAIFGFVVPVEVSEHQRVKKVRVARRIIVGVFRFPRVTEYHHVAGLRFSIAGEMLVRKRYRRTVGKLEPQ